MLSLLGLDHLLSGLAPDLGIDLGSAATPVLERGRGLREGEPTYVAVDIRENRVLAVGHRAREMEGRVPAHIRVVRPVRQGVVADFDLAEEMLRRLLARAARAGILRPRVLLGVPAGATEVEVRAVEEAAREAGARIVYTLPQPLVAALGAGLPVAEAAASLVCDLGGGKTEAATISMGGILVSRSSRVGGDRLDEALVTHLRRCHNLLVGPRSAERLKVEAGSALDEEPGTAVVRGRDLHSGLPRSLEVDSVELAAVLKPHLEEVADLLRSVLELTPPEMVSQVVERGVVLCGGASLLRGIEKFLSLATGVACRRAEDPVNAVVLGADRLFEDARLMRMALNGDGRRWV